MYHCKLGNTTKSSTLCQQSMMDIKSYSVQTALIESEGSLGILSCGGLGFRF